MMKLNPEIESFCDDNNLPYPTDIERANRAWELADADDLTLQAPAMVELFPGRPELHTAMRFHRAIILL